MQNAFTFDAIDNEPIDFSTYKQSMNNWFKHNDADMRIFEIYPLKPELNKFDCR